MLPHLSPIRAEEERLRSVSKPLHDTQASRRGYRLSSARTDYGVSVVNILP